MKLISFSDEGHGIYGFKFSDAKGDEANALLRQFSGAPSADCRHGLLDRISGNKYRCMYCAKIVQLPLEVA